MLDRLDHVAIAVRELRPAVDVYTRLLGREPSWQRESGGLAVAAFGLENAWIELHCPRGPQPALLHEHLDQQGEGLYALGFSTADVAASARELNARGLGRGVEQPGPDIRNPDGRSIESRRSFDVNQIDLRRGESRGIVLRILQRGERPELGENEEVAHCAQIAAVDHVVINTPAPEASLQLYRDQLGIRLALDRVFEDRALRLIFFRIGGVTVELAAAIGGKEDPYSPDLLAGLAYRVRDLGAARARIEGAGFEVSELRDGHKAGTRVCTVREPTHGVPTLLICEP